MFFIVVRKLFINGIACSDVWRASIKQCFWSAIIADTTNVEQIVTKVLFTAS